MASDIYQTTFNNIDAALATYINDVATGVIVAITPVATTLLLIYMIIWGWLVLTGKTGEIVTDGFNRVIKITLIVTLAINLGYYNSFVVDLLSNLPDRLADLASTTPTANTASFLDDTFNALWELGWRYMNKAMAESNFAGLADVTLTLTALAVWLFGVLLTVFAAFLIILSKMALSVLLGVGPIFILLTLFEPTKRFFDTWFGQCMNFILIVMLVGGILRLIVNILNKYTAAFLAGTNSVTLELSAALPAIILAAVSLLVLKQVMTIASALGGGMALSTLGAGRGIGQGFKNWDNNRKQKGLHAGADKHLTSANQLRSMRDRAKAVTARLKGGNSISS